MKIKTKPTERGNKRYILLETENKEAVEKSILSFIGTLGFSEVAPLFVELYDNDLKNNQYVLSINREKLNQTRAAFELSKDKIKIIRVSGTLKGLLS
jgi:RNase P/RNase MRP subunit POP5